MKKQGEPVYTTRNTCKALWRAGSTACGRRNAHCCPQLVEPRAGCPRAGHGETIHTVSLHPVSTCSFAASAQYEPERAASPPRQPHGASQQRLHAGRCAPLSRCRSPQQRQRTATRRTARRGWTGGRLRPASACSLQGLQSSCSGRWLGGHRKSCVGRRVEGATPASETAAGVTAQLHRRTPPR